MRSSVLSAAALLAVAPVANAASAHVFNKCNFPVYLWSIDTEQNPKSATVLEKGSGTYSEKYRKPTEGGVSIKLSPSDNLGGPVAQFEYTLGGAMDGHIWYDISFVDCQDNCPWKPHAMYMNSGSGCPTVTCNQNEVCTGAYNLPKDDWASRSCREGEDIFLYLCADSPNSNPAPAPSPSPSPQPAPSPSPQPASPAAPPVNSPAVKAQEAPAKINAVQNVAPAVPSPATTPAPAVSEHVEIVVVTVTQYSTKIEEYQPDKRHARRHVHHRRSGHQ